MASNDLSSRDAFVLGVRAGVALGAQLLARETGATIPDDVLKRFVGTVNDESIAAMWQQYQELREADKTSE